MEGRGGPQLFRQATSWPFLHTLQSQGSAPWGGPGRAGPGLSTPMAAASVVCVLKWQQRRRQSCVARGLLCCTPGQHSVSRESGLGKAPDSHREPQRAATVEEGEEPPPLSAPGRTGHVGSLGGAGRQVICHGAVRGWALSA